MNQSVISVENLGKSYSIKHRLERERYVALRDVLANKLKGAFRPGKRRSSNHSSTEDFWALKDVSFDVKQGEVLGIVGRNGAGKSTLLKILSRITEPTEGRVRIKGRVASLLEVGTGFHPELTGRENIYLNGAILGMTRAEIKGKFDEIVDFAEVEQFLDTPVKRYSSGMYVRLAFAVAAHLEPEILVVDEVLAVGDAAFQKRCLGKMQEVARGYGRTILFVSHNMLAVRSLCSRAILLSKGRLVIDESVDEVVESYMALGAGADLVWNRPIGGAQLPPIYYQKVAASLKGQQPTLQLILDAEVICENKPSSQTFVSVDLCDSFGMPLMQAIPQGEPFLVLKPGVNCLQIEVALPGLTPGRYLADLWIGTHYTETIDYVKQVIAIHIEESPMPNRTFPHTPDHGFMVAPSNCQFESTVLM